MRMAPQNGNRRTRAVLAGLASCIAACSASPREYVLVAIDDHPLPVVDSVNFGGRWRQVNRVMAGRITFVRPDSMLVEQTNRDLMTASWPCSVLRMAAKGGSGGMAATGASVMDTATAGCEELRTRQDTARFTVQRADEEYLLRQVLPTPDEAPRTLRAREHGDTIVVTDTTGALGVSPRTMVYVRALAPSA